MQKKPWLTIIGVGDDGWEGLSFRQQDIVKNARFIFGGNRHIAFLPKGLKGNLVSWPTPFSEGIKDLLKLRTETTDVVVLASGDPMFFGVGATLLRELPPDEVMVLPHPSSFSLASAKLGWPLQDVLCVSVHGRPIEVVNRYLQNNVRLLVLSENKTTPIQLAKLLTDRGFGESRLTVLEHLGGSQEHVKTGFASHYNDAEGADLNIVAIECVADSNDKTYSSFTALPDAAFQHDGQLTKQDIRAVTMAHLAPKYGELLWDVGAGCGSISIEWMRGARKTRVYAIEKNEKRQKLIEKNAHQLGVPGVEIVKGEAPFVFDGLERPDAIFIGGGFTNQHVFDQCWSNLKDGGRLVANAVTLETSALLQAQAKRINARLININISEAGVLGSFHVWRPSLPVTIMVAYKSAEDVNFAT